MGKMKDNMIDIMNDEGPLFDSAGYREQDRLLDDYYYQTEYNQNQPDHEPPYIAVCSDGKYCWEIKSVIEDVTYKIWAFSYKEALEMLPRIESF